MARQLSFKDAIIFSFEEMIRRIVKEEIGRLLDKGSIYQKSLTKDANEKPFYAAGKKLILQRDELENSRFMFPQSKTLRLSISIDREYMFESPCYRDAYDYKFSILRTQKEFCRKETLRQEQRTGLLCDFGEYFRKNLPALSGSKQMNVTENRFSLDNNESCFTDLESILLLDVGEITSQLKDNSTGCNLNKHEQTMPRESVFQFKDTFSQHKRKETARRVSSVVVLIITFLGLLFNICSQLSLMKVQPLHQERILVSISLLKLLGFMVFVWAVAIMILVGAPFTYLHRAMLIFWAIMMHITSANSISALYGPIPGILFMGWFACGKVSPDYEGK